jgi:hypothetical protein
MAFGRNLTASEIVDQALHFRRLIEVDHAVFMGMGEPMLNFDEVLAAARRLPDLGITHRRTTVSTVGWLPGLKRFVDEVIEPIRLALSLHAPDDELRSQIMPVNEKYPIADVVAECRRHAETTRRRVFVEYVMLAGVNDSREQARSLAAVLGREHFKVNLIPYNPWAATARRGIASRHSGTSSSARASPLPSGSRAVATSRPRAASLRRLPKTAAVRVARRPAPRPDQIGSRSSCRRCHATNSVDASRIATPAAIATSARLKATGPRTSGSGTPRLQTSAATNVPSAPPAAVPAPTESVSDGARGARTSIEVPAVAPTASSQSGRGWK